MNAPGISVLIPVYNSAEILPVLVERLKPVLDGAASRYELILVNDNSRDGSWRSIQELAKLHPWVRGIDLMRNYGQHNALLCGLRQAKYEITITMDDDLQHPPEVLPRLLRALTEDLDVVYGSPEQEQHGLLRDLASQLTKLVLGKAMGAETARRISALRVFRTQLREAFVDYRNHFVSIDVLLTWGTTRFSNVRVPHAARHAGRSNYTLRKLIIHTMNMITGFSVLPLQIASLIGFTFTIFGLAVLGWVLVRVLINGVVVPGFAFQAATTAIFSGAQLFALGMIGEYLARMHFRIMDRPPYAVRTDTAKVEPP